MELTKRIDLNLGNACNTKCIFCYYKDSLNSGPQTYEDIRKNVNYLNRYNVDTIDLTGGEPTIRPDFFEILKYVKSTLKINNVSLITNGLLLANETFVKKMAESGINDVLFSLHGYDEKSHDKLVGVGGAFNNIIMAMKSVAAYKVDIRVNTVITNYNYLYIKDIGNVLSKFKILNWNLILCNPILDAKNLDNKLIVKYSKASPYLNEVLEQFKDKIKFIFIKDIPYCFMEGHEKHVINLLQANYLRFEWDFFLRAKIRKGSMLINILTPLGFFLFMDVRNMFRRNFNEIKHDSFIYFQEFVNKVKPFRCRFCKFNLICPGIWRNYFKLYGDSELKPVKGMEILMPYHYIKDYVKQV